MEPRTDCSASRLCGGSRSIKAHPDCGTAVTALVSRAGWRGRSYGRGTTARSGQQEDGFSPRSIHESRSPVDRMWTILWTAPPMARVEGLHRWLASRVSVEAADDPDEL